MIPYGYNGQTFSNGPLGVGVEGMGFNRPQTDPIYQPIPAVRSVWAQLRTVTPNVDHVQGVTPVGLTGNGSISGMQGTLALAALSDFEAAAKAAKAGS